MQENKASGIWKWLLILLVLCNVALIATIWLKPGNVPPPHKPPVNFNERLNFTTDQNKKFEQLAAANRTSIDSLKKLSKEVREQFFAGISSVETNQTRLDSLSGLLGNYHRLIELQTYKHFSDVRAILDSRQKPIFVGLLQDVLRSLPEQPHYKGDGMRPSGPDGPPGGRRPPSPGPDGVPDDRQGPPPGGPDGPPPPPGDRP